MRGKKSTCQKRMTPSESKVLPAQVKESVSPVEGGAFRESDDRADGEGSRR